MILLLFIKCYLLIGLIISVVFLIIWHLWLRLTKHAVTETRVIHRERRIAELENIGGIWSLLLMIVFLWPLLLIRGKKVTTDETKN